ncbi:MAG: TIGR03088 family PEP-CTERM/XrtA system glycosyltransferase [Caldimonas sp.]
MDDRPLVMHVVYRFDTGGLENGVANLINHMPASAFRHAVVALTEVTDFRRRVRAPDVEFVSLQKGPGHGVKLYPRLYRLFRQRRPAIVHTRNLAALEAAVPAWLAGVPVCVHGEHGRDVNDLDGASRRYQWMRRAYRPFVDHYVALSRELADYLVAQVHVPPARVSEVCNGVDTARFTPAAGGRLAIPGCPFTNPKHWIVGTVGRMQAVKDQATLARAFVRVLQLRPALKDTLRLVLVGDGPLRAQCLQVLERAGVADLAWLPGERGDVEGVLRGLDCFVLPSLAEGISNTILEAMASGLPVIATAVGGNADLVSHGVTGEIVAAADVEAIAASLLALAEHPERAAQMGRAGRERAERRYSLAAMVAAYQGLYERQLEQRTSRARAWQAGL